MSTTFFRDDDDDDEYYKKDGRHDKALATKNACLQKQQQQQQQQQQQRWRRRPCCENVVEVPTPLHEMFNDKSAVLLEMAICCLVVDTYSCCDEVLENVLRAVDSMPAVGGGGGTHAAKSAHIVSLNEFVKMLRVKLQYGRLVLNNIPSSHNRTEGAMARLARLHAKLDEIEAFLKQDLIPRVQRLRNTNTSIAMCDDSSDSGGDVGTFNYGGSDDGGNDLSTVAAATSNDTTRDEDPAYSMSGMEILSDNES